MAAEILATPRLSQDKAKVEETEKKRKDFRDDPSSSSTSSFQSMNKSVEKRGEEEEDKPEMELLLLEVLALMEKESWWAWRCQLGTVLLALAFPIFAMRCSLDSISGFVFGALWAGLALTAVVLLQERRNALKQVGVGIKDKIETMRKTCDNVDST